jgi:PAS domain S-box-containing protein
MGEIIGLLGISRDITERKNSDRLLASERERLAVTLHSIGDGVISTDTVGKISMFNKAAQELTGWDATEAIGMPLPNVFKIVDQISRTPLENPIEKIIRTRERIELSANTSLMTRAGKELIISYSVDPMLDSENKIIGVVIVFRDMTEKIKLEATIQRNQKLESIGILAGGNCA